MVYKRMAEQEIKIENPFVSVFANNTEVDEFVSDNYFSDTKTSINEILSNAISINKHYEKLSETYSDIKRMEKTYIDSDSCDNTNISKLSKYVV